MNCEICKQPMTSEVIALETVCEDCGKRVEKATNAVFKELIWLKDDEFNQIHWRPGSSTLSYIESMEDSVELTEEEAKRYIESNVRIHLRKFNKVYLYSCKDNAEIAFVYDEEGREECEDTLNESDDVICFFD